MGCKKEVIFLTKNGDCFFNRVPVELSSCVSLFPLHSAIASSRLVSSLSAESMSWGLVPQGHSSLSVINKIHLLLLLHLEALSLILGDVTFNFLY